MDFWFGFVIFIAYLNYYAKPKNNFNTKRLTLNRIEDITSDRHALVAVTLVILFYAHQSFFSMDHFNNGIIDRCRNSVFSAKAANRAVNKIYFGFSSV